MSKKTLLLVDSNSLANRAFYALPSLSTSANVPTNAIYGFLTMLFRFIEERRPEYIACAFDHPSPTFRHNMFEEYKAKRKPAPESFKEQIPLLKEVLGVMKIPVLEIPGFEADDIIGTLTEKASSSGMDVIILSGDRDCLQLVKDGVRAILPVKGISVVKEYDSSKVKNDFEISPQQIVDFKALSGDSSDNIPGVRGIGEKTAKTLLSEYPDIETVYSHLGEIKPEKVRDLLALGKDEAFLSKKLATIERHVPLSQDVSEFLWAGPDTAKAKEVFNKLEFRSLLNKVDSLKESRKGSSEGETNVEAVHEMAGVKSILEPETIDSLEKLKNFCQRAEKRGQLAIYAEIPEVTRNFKWPKIIGVSDGDKAYILSARDFSAKMEVNDTDIYQKALWEHLGPLLGHPNLRKIGFDLKWVETLSYQKGLRFQGETFDVLVGAYLLDPTRTSYDLSDIARKYLDLEIPQDPKTPVSKKEKGVLLSGGADYEKAQRVHLGMGALYLKDVAWGMKEELIREGLWDLASQVEFPLIEVLGSMEAMGVGVDLEKGKELRERFGQELSLIEKDIFEMAGEEFNLGSPKQLAHILFEKMGLKPVKKTKTFYSTDAEVLETLAEENSFAARILEYRQYAKLKSTYLDVLEDVINPATGRIHSTFHQTVTATGRLSSSEPNLQNIPVRGELGKSIRRIFVPSSGKLFLASDYSQIELRIMAHMSCDPSMIEAFRKDEDIHRRTASEIFGIPLDEVKDDLRARAKAVNFGVIYGISDYGLARQTKVSRVEAKSFIENYFRRYPRIKAYMDAMIEKARKDKYVSTILGRRRPIPDIDARIKSKRSFAERTAINTPIQGSAADIIKLAMVRIYRRLRDEGFKSSMILQVHDELIFEILPSEEEAVRKLVKEEMEGAIQLKVPLKVEIDVGSSWYDV